MGGLPKLGKRRWLVGSSEGGSTPLTRTNERRLTARREPHRPARRCLKLNLKQQRQRSFSFRGAKWWGYCVIMQFHVEGLYNECGTGSVWKIVGESPCQSLSAEDYWANRVREIRRVWNLLLTHLLESSPSIYALCSLQIAIYRETTIQ